MSDMLSFLLVSLSFAALFLFLWLLLRIALKGRQERTWEPFEGPLFIQPLRVTWNTLPFTLSHSWEIDGQFRYSPYTVVWHMWPFGVGFGFGYWVDSGVGSLESEDAVKREEDLAFETYRAVNGNVSRDKWQRAREVVAAQGLDPDEEMELMQMLGAME